MSIEKILLDLKAVHLNTESPFTWASGIISPIYCDNRKIISAPKQRKIVINKFVEFITEFHPEINCIAGTATAGIPHASWIAWEMNLPLVYVRSNSKGHGLQNAIEGTLPNDCRCVLIEDLFSTGGSSLSAALKLQEAMASVESVISIFTYSLDKCHKSFYENKISYHSLCTIEQLLDYALKNKQINNEQKSEIELFLKTL